MQVVFAWIFLFIFVVWGSYQPIKSDVVNAKAEFIQNEVQTAIQQAKIKGYFSGADLQSIQLDVANHLGYPTSDVAVSGTTTPQTRGQEIALHITIPTTLNFMHFSWINDEMDITRGATAESELLQ